MVHFSSFSQQFYFLLQLQNQLVFLCGFSIFYWYSPWAFFWDSVLRRNVKIVRVGKALICVFCFTLAWFECSVWFCIFVDLIRSHPCSWTIWVNWVGVWFRVWCSRSCSVENLRGNHQGVDLCCTVTLWRKKVERWTHLSHLISRSFFTQAHHCWNEEVEFGFLEMEV